MNVLHESDYDIGKAVLRLVPAGGPVLCRDEMEEWSASEATLFEEAVEKYGKDFSEIRQDFVSVICHKASRPHAIVLSWKRRLRDKCPVRSELEERK